MFSLKSVNVGKTDRMFSGLYQKQLFLKIHDKLIATPPPPPHTHTSSGPPLIEHPASPMLTQCW